MDEEIDLSSVSRHETHQSYRRLATSVFIAATAERVKPLFFVNCSTAPARMRIAGLQKPINGAIQSQARPNASPIMFRPGNRRGTPTCSHNRTHANAGSNASKQFLYDMLCVT